MQNPMASAFASVRDRVEIVKDKAADLKERIQIIRDTAPTLTMGLVIVVFLVGGLAGWYGSKPFTRHAVNKEWRTKIATESKAVRAVINSGNDEVEATDDDIIKALGETDARLETAERAVRTASRLSPSVGECRIPSDRLRK